MRSIRMILAATLFAISAGVFATPPVNINTASAQALAEAINGVGLKRAQAIVRERETNGPFSSVDDLSRVQGIGQRIIERSREGLTTQ